MKIPGLTREMLLRSRGSPHVCTTKPILKSENPSQPTPTTFNWTVPGSIDVYNVQVKVLKNEVISSIVSDLFIICSCPDFEKQPKGRLCKHLFSCLEQLIDFEYEQDHANKKQKKIQELMTLKNGPLRKDYERISYGLEKASDSTLKRKLLEKSQTEEGLKLLCELFPKEEMPSKSEQMLHCTRCKHDYDPNYPTICEIPHSVDSVTQTNKTSKGSSYECEDCGKSWSDGTFGYYDAYVTEKSGACYRGPHSAEDEEKEEDEEDDD
jgi:hypothetical protein